MSAKVTIAISTISDRINSIKLPALMPEVRYLILHQYADGASIRAETAKLLSRADVRYFTLDSVGLSRSRNFALCNAKTAYVHLMDDDVLIDAKGILNLATKAEKRGADVAIGHFSYESGSSSKSKYNSRSSIRSFFSVCSIELCVHTRLRNMNMFFDSDLGLGAKYPSGEEFVFLMRCREAGLLIEYFNVSVGTHPNVTSGDDFFSSNDKILAKKIIFERAFKFWRLPYKILFLAKKFPVLYKNGRLGQFIKIFF